ncbi:MAG: hypothetical protein NTZ17_13690 [Phycisphaerae bacterium]|nr:hypothetical protein [Phycisphaerae bacterium]
MADSDFNTIKPVENLHNVAALTPTGQHQQRKRRQNPPRQGQVPREGQADETQEQQTPGRDGDSHTIDYCA